MRWYCVVCGDSGMADVLLNVLLFLPLGLLLRGLGWTRGRTVLLAAALSFAIEVVQGLLLAGRDACIGDFLANTSGAWLGWTGLIGVQRFLNPSLALARRGTAVLLFVMAAIWLATGAGLQPSLLDEHIWYGQPMSSHRGPQPFPGSLVHATIDGIEIPNEPMRQRVPWRDSIVIELQAIRNTDQLYPRGIVMLRIVDTARNVEAAIDQRGDDAWLRLRLRASDWRLHYPRWQVSHAMRMTPGVPWRFRWSWRDDHFTIINEPVDGPHEPGIDVPLSIGLGWSFIHPFVNIVGESRLLWTALWLGFWFGILGWLAGRLRLTQTLATATGALLLYAGCSLAWGMTPMASEMLIAIVAVAAGAIAMQVGRREW